MCILFVAWRKIGDYPLLIAANRDEFYQRPAEPARFWPGQPDLLAGRDIQAGGTWLGITRHGRFAAVTNFREPRDPPAAARSRGSLVTDFLSSTDRSAPEHAEQVFKQREQYAGFSLLLCDGANLVYCSNRESGPRRLGPGSYGLSNHLLDTDWPKLSHGKARFATALEDGALTDDLFALLRDRTPIPDRDLPHTGLDKAWERTLSPIFVATAQYGTRCSTVIRVTSRGQIDFEERTFTPAGNAVPDPAVYRAVRYFCPITV